MLYGGDITVLECYMVQNMCTKLYKHMGNVITVASNKKKASTIVYKIDAMSFNQALHLVATPQEVLTKYYPRMCQYFI